MKNKIWIEMADSFEIFKTIQEENMPEGFFGINQANQKPTRKVNETRT